MEYSKDFIERELQKLTLLLIKLISGLTESNAINFEKDLEETNSFLKKEFNLTITEITAMNAAALIESLKKTNPIHLEKIVELISVIAQKNEWTENKNEKNELISKGLVLIEYLNDKSDTFSFKRINLKSDLEKSLQ